ncbi:hypothetical protein D3C87_1632600 [compost metagenome]
MKSFRKLSGLPKPKSMLKEKRKMMLFLSSSVLTKSDLIVHLDATMKSAVRLSKMPRTKNALEKRQSSYTKISSPQSIPTSLS